jgi:lipoate-protein ligase A
MIWRVLDSGIKNAQAIMQTDTDLLESLHVDKNSCLHLYDWNGPSATYGYFLKPSELLLSQEGLQLARRPTGGGLVFHVSDLAFSVLLPATHPALQHTLGPIHNYKIINQVVASVLNKYFPNHYHIIDQSTMAKSEHFCMVKGTKYDVLVGDKKVVGAAQRNKKHGLLHQGSISLIPPSYDFLHRYLPYDLIENMQLFSHALLSKEASFLDICHAKEVLKKALTLAFQEQLS